MKLIVRFDIKDHFDIKMMTNLLIIYVITII